MRLLNFCILLLTMLLPGSYLAQAQRQSFFILPQATDAAIDNWHERHYVAINSAVAPRNQLLVWLPGTGGLPIHYQRITEHAADLGYHAMGLRYPNDEAVGMLCGPEDDLSCYAAVRQEILEGQDRSSLIAVSTSNSIENRLLKVLIYLHDKRPGENWDQFYDSEGVRWESVAVAGHSQGGGHAGYIASVHRVARVVMFASGDFDATLREPATWYDTDNPTPPSAYYGFGHTGDLLIFRSRMEATWDALGMGAFGVTVNVDGHVAPFSNSHRLLTSAPPAIGGLTATHNSVAVDLYTPRLDDNSPLHAPVWTYLFSTEVTGATTATPAAPSGYRFASNFPNPFSHTTSLRFSLPIPQTVTITIVDLLGRDVVTVLQDAFEAGTHTIPIVTSGQAPGIYLVRLTAGSFTETQRLVVLR